MVRFCPSVQRLEALLYMHAHPDRLWTPPELAGGVQSISREDARDLLATFYWHYWHGFLAAVSSDAFRYEPTSPELARAVDALAIYLVRLAAFVVILAGIAEKNRRKGVV